MQFVLLGMDRLIGRIYIAHSQHNSFSNEDNLKAQTIVFRLNLTQTTKSLDNSSIIETV